MKLYGGIDLHANNSVVVVIDEEDRSLYQKRLHNVLDEILLEGGNRVASLAQPVTAVLQPVQVRP